MNNLYISGDFVVSDLITDAAVIERFEKDEKAFINDWKDTIRSKLRTDTSLTVGGPVCVNVSLSKEVLIEEAQG